MPNHFPGPGFVSPDPLWITFISSGMAVVLWVAMLSLVLWAAYQWALAAAGARHPQPATAPREPSAVELLRRRYVLGDIDAVEFEDMLERIVASEVSFEVAQQMLEPRTFDAVDEYWQQPGALGE